MAITFGTTTLGRAASDAFDFPQDAAVWADQAVQESPLIRSEAPFYEARGNAIYNARFTVARRHASLEAAERFGGNHADAVRGRRTFSGLGLTLTRATCTARTRQLGIVTLTEYTIRGIGGGGSNPPDASPVTFDSDVVKWDSVAHSFDSAPA